MSVSVCVCVCVCVCVSPSRFLSHSISPFSPLFLSHFSLSLFLSVSLSLSLSVSQVRSVKLDCWTNEMIQRIREVGNAKANNYYEAKLNDFPDSRRLEEQKFFSCVEERRESVLERRTDRQDRDRRTDRQRERERERELGNFTPIRAIF